MEDTKEWWKSRIIWTSIISGGFAVMAMLGIVPENVTTTLVVEAIMAVVAIVTIYLRMTTTDKIAKKEVCDENGECFIEE